MGTASTEHLGPDSGYGLFFIQTVLPLREFFFFFFFLGAGHVGEAVPNAHCPLTRKLVTSPLKAGWVILAIADMHTDVWNPSGQCSHCS